MKVLLVGAGLPVGPYVVVPPERSATKDATDRALGQARSTLRLPVFVKPARAGSSVGITKVADWADLDAAVAAAREHDPKVLIEEGVLGREIECGVLQDAEGALEASVCAEIRVVGGQEFYDFAAKYLSDATEFDVPADLPAAVSERVRDLALRAFQALGCEGGARVDFFVGRRRDDPGQRGEHDPGLHPCLDVPQGLGGQRDRLSRARRPAPPRRHGQADRPALTVHEPIGASGIVRTAALRSERASEAEV